MPFDHQKLDVYHRALDAMEACDEVLELLPPGRAHRRSQVSRAADSIVANIAEGAGEFSPKEKARFYRMARRSAIEVAAWLDIIARRGDAPQPMIDHALARLEPVVAMLVRRILASAQRA
jgi:four helix bundle protein